MTRQPYKNFKHQELLKKVVRLRMNDHGTPKTHLEPGFFVHLSLGKSL